MFTEFVERKTVMSPSISPREGEIKRGETASPDKSCKERVGYVIRYDFINDSDGLNVGTSGTLQGEWKSWENQLDPLRKLEQPSTNYNWFDKIDKAPFRNL